MFVSGTMSRFVILVYEKRTPVLPELELITAVLVAVKPVRKNPAVLSGMIKYGRSTPSKYLSILLPSAFGPQLVLVFDTASIA